MLSIPLVSKTNIDSSSHTTLVPSYASISNIVPSVSLYSHPKNIHSMTTGSKANIFKPRDLVNSSNIVEPKSVKEALQHLSWKQAMKEEYDALLTNET